MPNAAEGGGGSGEIGGMTSPTMLAPCFTSTWELLGTDPSTSHHTLLFRSPGADQEMLVFGLSNAWETCAYI